MPKIALADSLEDWDKLITNAGALFEDIPDMEDLVLELREVLLRTRELAALRDHLESQQQLTTRQIKESQKEGDELARRIRYNVKAVHGRTSQRLVGYGVKPRPAARGERPSEPTLPPRRKKKPAPEG
jgi:hypothetical protein